MNRRCFLKSLSAVVGVLGIAKLALPASEPQTIQECIRWTRVLTPAERLTLCGDGITDNSAALQSLINEGQRVIYFPTGTYVFK